MRSIGISAHELCSVAIDAPRGQVNPTWNQLVTSPYVNVAVIAEVSAFSFAAIAT